MYDLELKVALEAVRKAGKYLLQAYDRFQVIENAPANITTEADCASQEIILKHILQNFPHDALCAEEPTATLRNVPFSGERLWIVDPIDGTRGFARKNGEFSIMVGFVHRGETCVGVVSQPVAARLTFAMYGSGCWRLDGDETTPQQCWVTDQTSMSKATLTQSRSKVPLQRSAYVKALNPGHVLETYSAGIKLALVARGEAEVYLNTYDAFHDWDICAGDILVTQAGGTVTGVRGEKLRYGLPGAWQRQGLLASNGKLHEKAIRRLADSLEQRAETV